MAVICDTGAVYALYDADDLHHVECKDFIESQRGPLLLPVALLAEIDYLLTSRLGVDASLDFLESLKSEAFSLVTLLPEDISRIHELVTVYRDLPLGLADASVVAAAERFQIRRIFTVDQRHFRSVIPKSLGHFELLPADR